MINILHSILFFIILTSYYANSASSIPRFLETTTYVTTLTRGSTVQDHCTNKINRQ